MANRSSANSQIGQVPCKAACEMWAADCFSLRRGNFGRGSFGLALAEEIVQIDKPRSGNQTLPRHVAVPLHQERQEVRLDRIAGSKVAVPSLTGEGMVTLPVPIQTGFTQARSGGDDGPVSLSVRQTRVQFHQILFAQHAERIGRRFQVVDDVHLGDSERTGHRPGVDDPRQVDALAASLLDGAGDPETSTLRRMAMRLQVIGDEGLQAVIVCTAVRLFSDGLALVAVHFKKRQDGLRPADVARQNHEPAPRVFSSNARLPPAIPFSHLGPAVESIRAASSEHYFTIRGPIGVPASVGVPAPVGVPALAGSATPRSISLPSA